MRISREHPAPVSDRQRDFFTEENSVDVVTRSNRNAGDPRLAEVAAVIIRKLHEAVKEIEPTQ